MTRVAVVDLGTNSTRLLVADVEGDSVREVDRRLSVTRLGEGVDERRRLLPAAVARVRNVLVEYRRAAEALGVERTLAIGTSAVRDAENGEAFLGEVEWSYGFATQLLSGDDEGLMTFRGVFADRAVPHETLVLDVGGGSTELIIGGPDGVDFRTSLDLGCVRLTERFLGEDSPAEEQLRECADHVRRTLAECAPEEVRPAAAIGVAGTVTTLATVELGLDEEDPALVHGHSLSTKWIEAALRDLGSEPVERIRLRPGIRPDRAPVIVAGIVVVVETLRHFGLEELEASEHDIMHGAALAAAELTGPVGGDAPPGACTCC